MLVGVVVSSGGGASVEPDAGNSPPENPGGSSGGSSLSGLARFSAFATIIGVPVAVLAILVQVMTSGSDDDSNRPTSEPLQTPPAASDVSPANTPRNTTPGTATSRTKQGDVTLKEGEHVDLETGATGTDVPGNDVSFSARGYSLRYLLPSSGLIAPSASTAAGCAKQLDDDERSGSKAEDVESGDSFCLRTVEGNIALVQIVKTGTFAADPISLHYIVWEQ